MSNITDHNDSNKSRPQRMKDVKMENDSINNTDIDSNNEKQTPNETDMNPVNADSPPESIKSKAGSIMEKFISIVGEENTKKVIEEGMLITTQNDIQQIIQNVGDNIVNSIGGKDTYDKISEGKVIIVEANQFINMKTSIQQSSTMLEQSSRTINELQSNLKRTKKITQKILSIRSCNIS